MSRDLETMADIMAQKSRDIEREGQPEMDDETKRLAEHKRFTFDVIDIPTDPLR